MSRREFSRKVKAAAFQRADGHCEGCTAPLRPGKIEYDHRISDAMGGEPTLENCTVLCAACHGLKTAKQDAPALAKARHREARHIGAKARSRRQLPGSKNSPWKQTINHGWVRRDAE